MNTANRDGALPYRLRKASLYSFVLFLIVSALVAIVTVVSGSFDVFQLKVLVTTTVIAAASVCALCCSAHAQRAGVAAPGILGVVLAVASAALFIVGSWGEIQSDAYWQAAIISGIFAIATAHTLTLLGLQLRSDHRWLKATAVATVFALAVVLSMLVLSVFSGAWLDGGAFTVIMVLAILVVLETLVIPVLSRLANDDTEIPAESLHLTRRDDGVYIDAQGRLYAVHSLSYTDTAADS